MPSARRNSFRVETTEHRRTVVARLRLRGATQAEICGHLAKQGLVNPKTKRPWSIATVNRDLKVIRAQWQSEYAAVFAEHAAGLLSQLREVRREAWRIGDLEIILKCCDREAKLLGLDQPDRLIVDWRREAQEVGIDAGELFERLVGEFAAIQRQS